jgi:hypothetical protein
MIRRAEFDRVRTVGLRSGLSDAKHEKRTRQEHKIRLNMIRGRYGGGVVASRFLMFLSVSLVLSASSGAGVAQGRPGEATGPGRSYVRLDAATDRPAWRYGMRRGADRARARWWYRFPSPYDQYWSYWYAPRGATRGRDNPPAWFNPPDRSITSRRRGGRADRYAPRVRRWGAEPNGVWVNGYSVLEPRSGWKVL